MEKLITGIHHVALKCRNMEHYNETLRFYTEILGIPALRSWGSDDKVATMIDTGAGILEIFSWDGLENPPEGAYCHLAFATKDTDACIKAVRDAGYKITQEPNDVFIKSVENSCAARIAFCIGPVGEVVEFFWEK